MGPGISGSGSPGTGNDLLDWTRWWNFERDRYLGLHDIQLAGPVSGTKNTRATRRSIMPRRGRIESDVLPSLLEVLESERDDSMVSSALIAVARIGSGERRDLAIRIGVAIKAQLRAKSQEVAETAALSLGIFGEDIALQPLLDLLASSKEGQRLVGEETVPSRTRAFAAFGLGLMAHQSNDPSLRQRIAAELMGAMTANQRSNEIPAAAALAMGLCPAPNRLTVPDRQTRESAFAHDVVSRDAQVRWLMDRIGAGGRTREPLPRVARVHATASLGRLGGDALPHVRARAIGALLRIATARDSSIHLATGALIGLGHAVTAGGDTADREGLQCLMEALQSGQVLERHFAAMAIAQATSRRGTPVASPKDSGAQDGDVVVTPEKAGWANVKTGRRALLTQLARGRANSLPWFALALGIQNWHLQRAGLPRSELGSLALRNLTRSERSSAFVGAFAIGCALAHEGADASDRLKAAEQIHVVFRRTKDPLARGQLAIALGLLNHEPARADLNRLMETSRFQPELLWSASVGLILLQDPIVVPTLIDTLKKARSASSRGAAAAALGRVGDRRATTPLLELLADEGQPTAARAFAIVGLGLLCEDTPLPWRTPAAHANPYFAVTATLTGNGRGLLDIN